MLILAVKAGKSTKETVFQSARMDVFMVNVANLTHALVTLASLGLPVTSRSLVLQVPGVIQIVLDTVNVYMEVTVAM